MEVIEVKSVELRDIWTINIYLTLPSFLTVCFLFSSEKVKRYPCYFKTRNYILWFDAIFPQLSNEETTVYLLKKEIIALLSFINILNSINTTYIQMHLSDLILLIIYREFKK